MKVLLIKKKISEVTMESRGYYEWKLLKVNLLSGIIYIMMRYWGKESVSSSLLAAMIPFGIQFFNSIVPFNVCGSIGIVVGFWIIKLVLSAVTGIIACPITTIYYLVKIIKAK